MSKHSVANVTGLVIAGFIAAFLTACSTSPAALQGQAIANADEQAAAQFKEKYPLPKATPDSTDNPSTPAKIALGRKLFFDPGLSSTGTLACSSCHDPRLGFGDGLERNTMANGKLMRRHSPTMINLAWGASFNYDGKFETLEAQAMGPMKGAMAMVPADLEKYVKSHPEYTAEFASAFPGKPFTINLIGAAIASFERSVVLADSPFDQWVRGDKHAISAEAKRGFVVFNTSGKCAECHNGWNFTDDGFYDIGLETDDLGRYTQLKIDSLKYAFKTSGLRNIAQRAPYMHTGKIKTLEAVIDHYDHGFIRRPTLSPILMPLNLSPKQKGDLLAFLNTLSSPIDKSLIAEAEAAEARIKIARDAQAAAGSRPGTASH